MNKKDLKQIFEQMSPNEEQKGKIFNKILENKTGQAGSVRKAKRKKPLIVAVALVCAVITTTVFAINVGLHEKLIAYFNIGERQEELVSRSIDSPDLSITNNDVTVTVKETIADSAGIYAICEITVPDHMTLPDNLSWELSVLITERDKNGKDNSGGLGFDQILEQDAHHAVGMASYFATVGPIKKGPVKLYLRNMGYRTSSGEFVMLIEGEWKLNWDMVNNDSGKTIALNYPLQIAEKSGAITEISISPISFNLRITGDNVLEGPIYLELFDRSRIPIDDSTGWSNLGGARIF